MTPRLTRAERQAIQRRLDRWELDHLRTLAAQQDERLAEQALQLAGLQSQLHHAEQAAEMWQRDCFDLQDEIEAAGGHLTLCRTGALGAALHAPLHPAQRLGARVLL